MIYFMIYSNLFVRKEKEAGCDRRPATQTTTLQDVVQQHGCMITDNDEVRCLFIARLSPEINVRDADPIAAG
jgi:hypothetical protein